MFQWIFLIPSNLSYALRIFFQFHFTMVIVLQKMKISESLFLTDSQAVYLKYKKRILNHSNCVSKYLFITFESLFSISSRKNIYKMWQKLVIFFHKIIWKTDNSWFCDWNKYEWKAHSSVCQILIQTYMGKRNSDLEKVMISYNLKRKSTLLNITCKRY